MICLPCPAELTQQLLDPEPMTSTGGALALLRLVLPAAVQPEVLFGMAADEAEGFPLLECRRVRRNRRNPEFVELA